MKGLIRLRSQAAGAGDVVAAEEDTGSGESEPKEHIKFERRLDHDLTRFEMVQLPAAAAFDDDEEDDEACAARLQEENLTLRDRHFLMERDIWPIDLRCRLLAVEELCWDYQHRGGWVMDAAAEAAPQRPSPTSQACRRCPPSIAHRHRCTPCTPPRSPPPLYALHAAPTWQPHGRALYL
ncbi:hypothetical protein EJB05_26039, partial [Eragrostis curvula]